MIKVSKKAIGAIAGTSVAIITAGAIGANFLLKEDSKNKNNVNPLNRDNNYRYYSISNKILANNDLNKLISISHSESSSTYILDENKFLENIKFIVQNTLSKIAAFKQDYLNYTIDINYKITGHSIDVDLVW